MKPLEFKFWDAKHNAMISWDTAKTFYVFQCNKLAQMMEGKLRYTPLQYTGLKDINGKKIFEDDVVRVNRNDSYSYSNTGVVMMVAGCYGFYSFKRRLWVNLYSWPIDEVLGNIYENRDLLKELQEQPKKENNIEDENNKRP